jgi:hypothetical protein
MGWVLVNVDPLDADLVVWNARVYTVDARTPRAEAFASNAVGKRV